MKNLLPLIFLLTSCNSIPAILGAIPTPKPTVSASPTPTLTSTPLKPIATPTPKASTGPISCKNIVSLPSSIIYKAISKFDAGDWRNGNAALVGVGGEAVINSGSFAIYNTQRKPIGAFEVWVAPGTYKFRAYARGSGESYAKKALSTTNTKTILIAVDANRCVKIPDASKCIHSSSC